MWRYNKISQFKKILRSVALHELELPTENPSFSVGTDSTDGTDGQAIWCAYLSTLSWISQNKISITDGK